MIAAVIAFDRREFAGPVLLEVGPRDDAAAALARRDDGVGDPAAVEAVRSPVADLAQALGQILLHQPVADLERPAFLEEDGPDAGPVLVEQRL